MSGKNKLHKRDQWNNGIRLFLFAVQAMQRFSYEKKLLYVFVNLVFFDKFSAMDEGFDSF